MVLFGLVEEIAKKARLFCTLHILNAACCLFYTSNVCMFTCAISISYTPFKKLLKCKLYEIKFSVHDVKSDYINHCTALNWYLADSYFFIKYTSSVVLLVIETLDFHCGNTCLRAFMSDLNNSYN